VGDTGDVSPQFFRRGDIMCHVPPLSSLKVLYLEWFQKKMISLSIFRARRSCSKTLDDKKYFNAVKNSMEPPFFRAMASCSKILNDKDIFNTVKNFRATINEFNCIVQIHIRFQAPFGLK